MASKARGSVLDRTWPEINRHIMGASEAELERLLVLEADGRGRISVMLRLSGRLNKLRARAARRALFSAGRR